MCLVVARYAFAFPTSSHTGCASWTLNLTDLENRITTVTHYSVSLISLRFCASKENQRDFDLWPLNYHKLISSLALILTHWQKFGENQSKGSQVNGPQRVLWTHAAISWQAENIVPPLTQQGGGIQIPIIHHRCTNYQVCYIIWELDLEVNLLPRYLYLGYDHPPRYSTTLSAGNLHQVHKIISNIHGIKFVSSRIIHEHTDTNSLSEFYLAFKPLLR